MDFLEMDLEDILFNTPSEYLEERGLQMYGKRLRQLYLGNYGRADLITIRKTFIEADEFCLRHHEFVINIYELKKDAINIYTYLQAIRYCRAIQRIIESRSIEAYFKFKIILIGKIIDINNDFIFLPELNNNVEIYTYQYKIDGLHFTRHKRYKLSNENLPFTNKNKVRK